MLVLSRKYRESVVGGGHDGLESTVKVTVLEIGHGSVRLGFEANRDIPVHREEVRARILTSRPRDPPAGGFGGTGSRNAHGEAAVLSGMGKGRSPKFVRGRSVRVVSGGRTDEEPDHGMNRGREVRPC